jgi:MFS family permease
LSDLFSPRHFTRFVGQRWAVCNVTTIAGTFLLGSFLDAVRFPINFQVMYVVVGLTTMVSAVMIARLRLPARVRRSPESKRRGERLPLSAFWHRYRTFVMFEIAMCVAYLALNAASPLYRIYWVRDLGAAGTWLGALTAAFALGAILGNLVWGRLGHSGHERACWLIGACGYMGAYPLLTSYFGGLAPLLAVNAVCGFFAAANDLMMFKRMVQLMPRLERPRFLSINYVVLNTVAFVGPLGSTLLADSQGTRHVLVLLGLLGFAGAALLYLLPWGKTPDEIAAEDAARLATAEASA